MASLGEFVLSYLAVIFPPIWSHCSPFMCSFLLLFLIYIVVFDICSNYAKHCAPEVAQAACCGSPPVVFAQERHQETLSSWFAEGEGYPQTSSVQGYALPCPYQKRNGFIYRGATLGSVQGAID